MKSYDRRDRSDVNGDECEGSGVRNRGLTI